MKVVILAGGLGSRLSEESQVKPKPMVEIGGKPILWHIMKIYSHYGLNEFIICCGYKGYVIKEYFSNYFLHNSDVTFDVATNSMEVHQNSAEPWKVTLVDTGEETLTGGRIKRIENYVNGEEFCCTYGDGLSDVNISKVLEFHKRNGKLATLVATQPPGRFGLLSLEGDIVTDFHEKAEAGSGFINGGFFVLSPKVFKYIAGDKVMFEGEPLEQLAKDRELAAFQHRGFWHPMDTLRDKNHLEGLYSKGQAPWKVW